MQQNGNGASVLFWMQTQQRKVEAEASGNQARLRGARNMAEVVRLSEVHVPAELRALRSSIPGIRTLQAEVERRLRHLVDVGLKAISEKTTSVDAKAERVSFMRECEALRGVHAHIYRQADAESARAVFKLEQAEKAANPPPPVDL